MIPLLHEEGPEHRCVRCRAAWPCGAVQDRVWTTKCPGCELRLPTDYLIGQKLHMEQCHPDIVAERQAESARWDGWEND